LLFQTVRQQYKDLHYQIMRNHHSLHIYKPWSHSPTTHIIETESFTH
jgi:hypothetical protein